MEQHNIQMRQATSVTDTTAPTEAMAEMAEDLLEMVVTVELVLTVQVVAGVATVETAAMRGSTATAEMVVPEATVAMGPLEH